jgi:hypothetical protein
MRSAVHWHEIDECDIAAASEIFGRRDILADISSARQGLNGSGACPMCLGLVGRIEFTILADAQSDLCDRRCD